MKLVAIKTVAEVLAALKTPTPGRPQIEIRTVDGTVKALRIGGLHCEQESYSSFRMLAERNTEEVSGHRVRATVEGFATQVFRFTDYAAAVAKRDSFPDAVAVELDEVTLIVNEAGEIVSDVEEELAKPAADASDDLPF